MKKLLIAMTAAAVGTCAWATAVEVADATLLNENFDKPAEGWSPSSWTVAEDGKVTAVAAPWSYAGGTDVGDGELTLANDALSLNTGSKVLTAAFAGGDAVTIPSTNVYFNATVTFKDPSDTLPELKDSDKFALVVLDNVESIEEGYTDDPATNLWVIAKYGESGQRAYQLDVAVTPIWLADDHDIVVKAYENVMASGYTACAGFIVMVDKTVCKVVQSCALEGNVINYAKSCSYLKWNDSLDASGTGDLGYLGYPLTAIDPKYQKHCCDPEDNNTSVLILSNVPSDGTLTSVDFQGQGDIDNVNLAATTTEDFGSDALAIAVTADAGVTLKNCADGTLYYSGTSATITFELEDGYILTGDSADAVKGSDGVYSLTINPTQYTDGFKVEAFLPVVSVEINGETKKFGSLSKAIDEVDAGAELKLNGDITLESAVGVDKDITINLNGQELAIVVDGENIESMFELAAGVTLTITDTEGGVLAVDAEEGVDRNIALVTSGRATVAINKGTIDAAAVADAQLTYNITGGKFLKEANASITVDDNKYVVDRDTEADYYIVKDKPAAPSTFAVTYDAGNFELTKLNGETYEPFTSGTKLANGTYTFKVVADENYKVDSVTVGNTTATVAEDGTFSVEVNGAAVAIVVTTRVVKYPVSEGLVEGDVTTAVAGALDELAEALGGGDDAVTNFITQVCGGAVDAPALTAAQTAGTIDLSANYDLPLMEEVPTVTEIGAEAATADDAAAFSFKLMVGDDPVEIKKVTDKVRKMIQYGTTLSDMDELTAGDIGVALEFDATSKKIKVRFSKTGGNAGFMKVKLNK